MQVKSGDCNEAAPGMLSMPGSKLKWEAWNNLKGAPIRELCVLKLACA